MLTHVDNMGSEWDRLNFIAKVKYYVLRPWYRLNDSWPSLWSSAPIKGKEVRRMFHSKIVQEAVKQTHADTGLPTCFIHPVVNYTDQEETTTEMNILHLYTLSKVLDLARQGANDRLRYNP